MGLYVSSHPLRDLGPYIRREAEHLISELDSLPDGSFTTVIGMVSTVKRITTKKSGEMMAFVTVDGLDGSVEMPCFPKVYAEHKEYLEEDRVLKIRARVDRKDENETKLIPAAIEPFVVKRGDEPVRIVLDGEQLPRTVLDELKTVIGHFPGACPVVVQVLCGERPPATLRFGDTFRVDPQTSFFAELQVLLGEGCVRQL